MTINGFHIHMRGHGFTELFVFYGPRGMVCAVYRTGITIQREVRESSGKPHFSNIPNIYMPSLTLCWQHQWFTPMLPTICLLKVPQIWHHSALPCIATGRQMLPEKMPRGTFVWSRKSHNYWYNISLKSTLSIIRTMSVYSCDCIPVIFLNSFKVVLELGLQWWVSFCSAQSGKGLKSGNHSSYSILVPVGCCF